ncbi:MAG TPA: hypothetical protein VF628_06990 [Allosphingosinicella sp.]
MPQLDGLKGIAVLLVVASHIGSPAIPGVSGATLFFISGFIIPPLPAAPTSPRRRSPLLNKRPFFLLHKMMSRVRNNRHEIAAGQFAR